jgi:signal peptidase II
MNREKFYLIVALVFVLDHVTKWLARVNLSANRRIELLPGYLSLDYATNSGVAFGLFEHSEFSWKPYILAGLAIVALLVLVVYSLRAPRGRFLLQWALAITAGGIVGNLVDRIAHGYVVDFIEFHIREVFYWPTFNLADSAITIGIALLLIDTVKNPAMEQTAEQQD